MPLDNVKRFVSDNVGSDKAWKSAVIILLAVNVVAWIALVAKGSTDPQSTTLVRFEAVR